MNKAEYEACLAALDGALSRTDKGAKEHEKTLVRIQSTRGSMRTNKTEELKRVQSSRGSFRVLPKAY